jgi:hypothetical protein
MYEDIHRQSHSITTATGKLLSGLTNTNIKGHKNDIDTSSEESIKKKHVRRCSFIIYRIFLTAASISFYTRLPLYNNKSSKHCVYVTLASFPRSSISLKFQNAVSSTWTKLSRGGAKFCCTSPKCKVGQRPLEVGTISIPGNGERARRYWPLDFRQQRLRVHVRDSAFSIGEYHGKSGNANFRFREPRNQLRGLRSEAPAPQTKENWASRPLCHT